MSQTPGVSERGRRRRSWRPWAVAGVVVLALLGLAAWLGTSWLGTYRQAQDVQAEVTSVRSALEAREWAAVARQVPDLTASSGELAKSTSGVAWRVLSSVPVVGATASAVADLSLALADISQAADPLVPYAERIVSGQVRRPDGSIDLAAMADVAPLLDRLSAALASASLRLEGIDEAAVREEVAGPVVELREQLASAVPAVETAAELSTWIPGMLGASGPRSWMVMLQNPAEARATGGFPGGYVVLTARDGALGVTSAGTSSDLARTAIPTDSAPDDAVDLWGDRLKAWNTFNQSAHFPLVAELAADGMAARDEPVDGVLAIDPATVAAMLAVTGPVTAAGVTIDSGNAEEFFTIGVYREYPDPVERDEVTMALVQATLEAFLQRPWEPAPLAEALEKPVSEGRIKAWSSAPVEQEWLASGPVGGVVPDTQGSVVAVAFNNSAGNKMDAFVATAVDYRPGRCPTSTVQQSQLSVGLRNDAPAKLPVASGNYGRLDVENAPPGSTSLTVYIYAPVGANYLSSTLDGEESPLYLGRERNRQVWYAYVPLDRGQERTLAVQFEEPTVLGVEPRVVTQPMVIDEVVTIEPDPSC